MVEERVGDEAQEPNEQTENPDTHSEEEPAPLADQEPASVSLEHKLVEQTRRAEALEKQVAVLEEKLGSAVQGYRLALLETSPEIPSNMLTGETAEELQESLALARSVVEQVKGRLEAESERGRVPAGSPARQQADVSRLSAQEKIALGLERSDRFPPP